MYFLKIDWNLAKLLLLEGGAILMAKVVERGSWREKETGVRREIREAKSLKWEWKVREKQDEDPNVRAKKKTVKRGANVK